MHYKQVRSSWFHSSGVECYVFLTSVQLQWVWCSKVFILCGVSLSSWQIWRTDWTIDLCIPHAGSGWHQQLPHARKALSVWHPSSSTGHAVPSCCPAMHQQFASNLHHLHEANCVPSRTLDIATSLLHRTYPTTPLPLCHCDPHSKPT